MAVPHGIDRSGAASGSGAPFSGDFIQAGTGAILRAMQDKVRESVSVKDFGTTGLGVTDDTAAIQTAIASGAKTIYGVQGDTYLLGAAGLQFASLTGVRFVANGATLKFNIAATQTMGGFGSTMILFSSCINCGIEGWTIDGNSKATNAIGFTGCTESYADRNRITASGLNAQIVSVSNTRNRYADNTVYSSIGASRGMWLGNTNAGEQETDPLITGNVVRSNAGSGISGTRYGGRILGNVCLSNGGAGIVEGGEHATGIIGNGVVISGNTCNSNTFHGIQLGDIAGWLTSADSTYNLTVQGNHCALNTQSGIYVVNVRDSSVAGNVCVDNGGNGITASPAIRVALSANICYDSRSGGSRTQDFGILIIAQTAAGECANLSLTGNICYNHVVYGIYAVTTAPGTITGLVLSGNISTANSGIGIAIINDAAASVLESVVVGNRATGNTTADFRIDPLDVVLSGNKYATMSGTNPTGAFTFTDTDTTPSVKGREYFKCGNTGATVITAFDDGAPGQVVEIIFTNANTTVTDGGTIFLAGAANFVSSADDVLRLRFNGTNWYETSRSVN